MAKGQIKQTALKDLIPYVNNARKHSEEQINRIAASIKEFGFINPILIDKDSGIIAGHGRFMAAQKLGMMKAPTLLIDHLSEAQKKAYILADNRLAELSEWDIELVDLELQGLLDEDFDISIAGFDESWLVEEVTEGLIDEDEVPETPEEPKSKLGDVWMLGDHRLICGDSTDAGTVAILMDGNKADMVFTDPPYNTGMTSSSNGTERLSHMFDDAYTDEEWAKFLKDFCARYDESTKETAFIYIFLDWRRSHELVPVMKSKWKFSNLIVLDKMIHGLGSDYKYTHEFMHVCKKGSPKATNREGDKEYQDVWRIQRKIGRNEEHATKKPIELCERAIRHGSKYKDIVLDLFGGSGSTLIAAEKNNRHCYMMELDPKYVDVIIKRWQDFTGKEATREDGVRYNDI